MNAIPKPAADLLLQTGQLSESVTRPIPGSRKIFVEGSRPDLRVAMREIAQTRTPTLFGGETNPPITVYDPSGPYTDPDARIDLAVGLPALRAKWIEERGDTELLPQLSSAFGRGREHDPKLAGVRFPVAHPAARGQGRRQRQPDALCAPRHRHPGDGIRRHPREPAPGCGPRCAAAEAASRRVVRRQHPEIHHPRIRARRDRPRPRDPAQQHQPPGKRADDHRPQLPDQDQRQHRQQRGVVGHRGRSRKAGVVDPLGRRHGDGPQHRQAHPRNPRMDHPQFAGADRHRADLPGAGKGRRPRRGTELGDLPRHADRAGRAGRGLLHHPRRRAAAPRAADRQARYRHRLARRFDHGQVVPGAPQGELPLHALRGHLRNHEGLRRGLLAGRRPAARLHRRCQRRRAVRRAGSAG